MRGIVALIFAAVLLGGTAAQARQPTLSPPTARLLSRVVECVEGQLDPGTPCGPILTHYSSACLADPGNSKHFCDATAVIYIKRKLLAFKENSYLPSPKRSTTPGAPTYMGTLLALNSCVGWQSGPTGDLHRCASAYWAFVNACMTNNTVTPFHGRQICQRTADETAARAMIGR